MSKIKLATVSLDGCSGCHMSLQDIDEALAVVARKADIVYGPLVDAQEFPEGVDVTLVEGAISNQDDLKKIQTIRRRSRMIVSLGDCAVTGNVPAMRNTIPVKQLLDRVYVEGATATPKPPGGEESGSVATTQPQQAARNNRGSSAGTPSAPITSAVRPRAARTRYTSCASRSCAWAKPRPKQWPL